MDTLICARIRVMRCNPRPRGIQGAGVVGMVETAVTCKPIHKSADLLSVRFSKSSRSILSRIYKLTLHFVLSMRENRCLPTHFPSPTPLLSLCLYQHQLQPHSFYIMHWDVQRITGFHCLARRTSRGFSPHEQGKASSI